MLFKKEFEKETGYKKESQISPNSDFTGMSFFGEYRDSYIFWLESKLTSYNNNNPKEKNND